MENFRKFSQVETLTTIFAHRFLLAYFYRNIYVSGNFYRIIYVFYTIIYVSGNFTEIFITNDNLYNKTIT
jgi:hypothetical protein